MTKRRITRARKDYNKLRRWSLLWWGRGEHAARRMGWKHWANWVDSSRTFSTVNARIRCYGKAGAGAGP